MNHTWLNVLQIFKSSSSNPLILHLDKRVILKPGFGEIIHWEQLG